MTAGRIGERKNIPHSARGNDLALGYDNMAAHAIRVEIKFDLGIERARQIAFDYQAAEAAIAPRLHLRTELLAPIDLNGIVSARILQAPVYRYASARNRKRSEPGGIDHQLMQCQPEILRRFWLEPDLRTVQHDLPMVDMGRELRAD